MTSAEAGEPDPETADPRALRSRARLLDAATTLLHTGGVDAVTIEAVTRLSKVARTTLYRHFDNVVNLRAATLERLFPPVPADPPVGPLRDCLVELLIRQATAIDEMPLQLTTLAWLSTADTSGDTKGPALHSLRHRLMRQYREPFDRVLDSDEAREALGDYDRTLLLTQLMGPIVFTRLAGVGHIGPDECARIVDDLLIARRAERDRS